MPRIFVAIRPPRIVRSRLIGIMGGVAGARWQDDAQLHCTLRFIGEVDYATAEDVAFSLETVDCPKFEIAIDGLGTFCRKGRVDALWAGLAPSSSLEALHLKIDRALIGIGLPPEGRKYKPHITLARFGRQAGDMGDFFADHAGLSCEPFVVEAFHLYESHLGSAGAHYRIIRSFALLPS